MQPLTPRADEQLRQIAERYGVSSEAAQSLLDSLQRGGGTMAQFNHPEVGGYGQWMRGGMTMVGDMFNNSLRAKVDGLCSELAGLLESGPFEPPQSSAQPSGGTSYQAQGSGGMNMGSYGSNWWPDELGHPSTSGAQNDMRYAYFPGARRLAIQQGGVLTIYDTLDHQIGGVSQQQGGGYSLSFTSQLGGVDLRQLPTVWSNASQRQPQSDAGSGASARAIEPPATQPLGQESEQDVFAKIERLAALKEKGVLSDEEFAAKKAELLARI
jgi:hypothetical protein